MADRVILLPDGTTLIETGERVYPLPGGTVVETVADETPTFNPAWARNCNNLIGAGI